jgi:membrane fusion protein, heavy metal efflux system
MKKIIYSIILVTLVSACTDKPIPVQDTMAAANESTVVLTDEQVANGGIVTGKVDQKNLSRSIRVTGSIEAPPGNVISVSFPYGGYVRKMNLLPGTQVSLGDLLVTLEDPQYIQLQQDYLTAKSRFAFLETEYNRQKELNADKTTSDKLFQQVRDEYESQRISVKALGEKLKLIRIIPDKLRTESISGTVGIYSPINGFVTDIFVNTGKYVNPTDVLFELVNPADVHLILNVHEQDINSVEVGQTVTCYKNNDPKKYSAVVHLISKSVKNDRTSEVHCDFKGDASAFLPGMFVSADVELLNRNVTAVPDDAIVRTGDRKYVFIVTGKNEFHMTSIETGMSANGFTEVMSEMKANDIVVKNAYTLLMKLKKTED